MALELLITDEAICLDKAPGDPSAKVVPCTSPAAAFQLVGKHTPISQADAERFGVKTKPAEATNYTLRVDSHTIARTPEEKAYAATQPQSGLLMAQGEQIRSAAALQVASLGAASAARHLEAEEESKQATAEADKKLKATLENKSKTTKAKRSDGKVAQKSNVAKKTTARKTTKAKAPRKSAKKADEPKPETS